MKKFEINLKKITDICVEGQQEIFKKMDIKWDRFTHESDFVFENKTTEILEQLKEKGKLHEDEMVDYMLI